MTGLFSSDSGNTPREREGKSQRWKAEEEWLEREGAANSHTNRWELQSSSQYLLFLGEKIGSVGSAVSVADSGSILVCVKEALMS